MVSLVQDVPRAPRLQVVDVRGNILRRYTKNALQRSALSVSRGNEVEFIRGRVSLAQIEGRRDSYVNAVIIQSRGGLSSVPCDACQRKMMTNADAYANPFPYCIRLPGHFSGACGNCKWSDHAASCSQRDGVGAPLRRAGDWHEDLIDLTGTAVVRMGARRDNCIDLTADTGTIGRRVIREITEGGPNNPVEIGDDSE